MDNVDEHGLPLWPAPERNKGPILEQLLLILEGRSGILLEIAAATGQHAAHFAAHLSEFEYYPSDYDEEHLQTLAQRQKLGGTKNLHPPLKLDVTDAVWPLARADVIYNANMMHIAPFEVSQRLFAGAGRLLGPADLLITYGPYKVDGRHTSESNEQFDESLRKRNPAFGVRDLAELGPLARAAGFSMREPVQMPANNLLLVWERA